MHGLGRFRPAWSSLRPTRLISVSVNTVDSGLSNRALRAKRSITRHERRPIDIPQRRATEVYNQASDRVTIATRKKFAATGESCIAASSIEVLPVNVGPARTASCRLISMTTRTATDAVNRPVASYISTGKTSMTKPVFACLTLLLGVQGFASAREAKLVRYPDYHAGKVAFAYLGDIWTADEDGKNIQRLTVHTARDIHPRFSPDGRSIAFSSDREGNMDVYLIPTAGGAVKRLTIHSADDTVLDWTPDGKGILFASQRGEDFMGKLYVVSIDGGMPRDAGPDMGVAGSFSPDGTKLAVNRKAQAYWRKYYRGAYQSDVTVMDLASKTFKDVTSFDGMDSWPLWSRDGYIYFVSDREGKGQTNIWRVGETGGEAEQVTRFTGGDVRFPGSAATARRSSSSTTSASGSSTSPAGRSSRSRSRSPPKPRRP